MTLKTIPNFKYMAVNVYRTRHFIVQQRLFVLYDKKEANALISRDTYFKRNKRRDAMYEILYTERENVDGKRLPSTTYIREYR